ncbi:MAG: PIN domain-containing protein [Sedimentisphaerales bacterium]|nr:PIN domain-containing protein [Sedimentisphaerales bacterium]
MVSWFVRAIFVLLIAATVMFSFSNVELSRGTSTVAGEFRNLVFAFALVVVIMGFSIDLLVRRKTLAALAGIFFGLLVGLLIGLGFNSILDFLYEVYRVPADTALMYAKDPLKLSINILCCYLAITFVMQTKDDFRFIIPYVEFSKQTKGVCPLILDTSVIIDGRIADIAATKILNSPLIVPRFVLNELQNIADSADRMRRTRGRRGLDVLNVLQSTENIDITVQEVHLSAAEQAEPVDHQLVATGIKLGGKLVTNDYNLNKVASIRGVDVININDLANAMKPILLPGENILVKLVKPGDQNGQGVGYLDDGTMIVVDNGRGYLNQEVEPVVTSVLQTSAGRMIFARMDDGSSPALDSSEGRVNQRPGRGSRDNRPYSRSSRPSRDDRS